jgi:ABC-type Fe3+/spermidine/putrescine transport system ATPase subunit
VTLLHCRRLTVGYGAAPVLDELDLVVAPGESLALLGPSGSGKTTLLHTVAGFLAPRSGEILLGERVVTREPPERRNVGLVFQHYALWPHLDALDNVAYPIRRRGVPAAPARREAQDLLERLGIGPLARRRPDQLSGGQQQRVGLARALARRAALYLFDEPTAHLDAALRSALQEELSERRRETGAGALYATHDAAEALAVADRVALLRDGRVVQTGSPVEIYDRPLDLWAARLTGAAAVLEVEVGRADPPCVELTFGGTTVEATAESVLPPGPALALIRPEWAGLGGRLPGLVRRAWYRGPHTDYRLETPAGEVVVRLPGPPRARPGERTGWSLDRVWLLYQPRRSEA